MKQRMALTHHVRRAGQEFHRAAVRVGTVLDKGLGHAHRFASSVDPGLVGALSRAGRRPRRCGTRRGR